MNHTILFESFLVFYLLQILVLISAYFYITKPEKTKLIAKRIEEENTKPTASAIIKIRRVVKQLERMR